MENKPVKFAAWEVTIVSALKKDVLSMCVVTVRLLHLAANCDTYTLPHVEDLFTALAGGKVFSKQELVQVHWHIVLGKASRS